MIFQAKNRVSQARNCRHVVVTSLPRTDATLQIAVIFRINRSE